MFLVVLVLVVLVLGTALTAAFDSGHTEIAEDVQRREVRRVRRCTQCDVAGVKLFYCQFCGTGGPWYCGAECESRGQWQTRAHV